MILQQQNNIAVAAPQVSNIAEMLDVYKTYTGAAYKTTEDLVTFLTTPSQERSIFLKSREYTIAIVNNKYATQTYV